MYWNFFYIPVVYAPSASGRPKARRCSGRRSQWATPGRVNSQPVLLVHNKAQDGMYAIFHNHMQFATEGFSYDPFLAVSPAVMMNFDMGHFFGSTGIHPNTIIEKYHDRIFSIHIKDKTGPKTDPANMNQAWGQGEAPIADVLLLLKEKKWPITCDIELEYEIKPWSNAVKETATCVKFARQILM